MAVKSEHWDGIFSQSEDSTLGWYEQDVTQTLLLLKEVPNWERSHLFLAGAGTSGFVDRVLQTDASLLVNDISQVALDRLKNRIGPSDKITFLCQDISTDITKSVSPIDLWIDRAVLHFLTDDKEVQGYISNLNTLLKVGGFVLFAEFSTKGAKQCAGLPIRQYDQQAFADILGDDFVLVTQSDYTYVNPNGDDRPYIYALYNRRS